MRLTFLLVAIGACACAEALVYEQANTKYSDVISQDFTDEPVYSMFGSDDIRDLGNVRITRAIAYGTEWGLPSENQAVVFGIGVSPDRSSIFSTSFGFQVGEDLVFQDLSILVSGDMHVFFWVVRPFDPGRTWYWNLTQTVSGREAYLHNPLNGFGFGERPFPIRVLLGQALDGSFRMEYELVPEPATLIGVGLGALAFGRSRLRRP